MKTIKRIKVVPGYGERYLINTKDKELCDFFRLICLWTQDYKIEKDLSTTTTFELPVGVTYENSVIIRLALERLGYKVED